MNNFYSTGKAWGLVAIMSLLCGPASQALASDADTRAGSAEEGIPTSAGEAPAPAKSIVYVPPLRGAPGGRVGGGTRGASEGAAVVQVLAPDHTGYTTMAQPDLYWFASGPGSARLEVTLIDGEGIDPLVETSLPCSVRAGIQRLDLGDYDVELAPGEEYEWSVALVTDPKRRSSDVISAGRIKRVDPSTELAAKLDGTAEEDRPSLYASEGIWYDAVASVSRQIEEDPGDAVLQTQRAALLAQVGLDEAAAYERGR